MLYDLEILNKDTLQIEHRLNALMGDNTMTEETKAFDLNEELNNLAFVTEDGSGYVTFNNPRSGRIFLRTFDEGDEDARTRIQVQVKSIGNKDATLSDEDNDRMQENTRIARDLIRYARYKGAADESKFMLDMFHDINVD